MIFKTPYRIVVFALTAALGLFTANTYAGQRPGSTPAVGHTSLDFNRDVRPILSDKCFACHGPDKHERKADLRLDTHDGAMRDLGGYAALLPGNIDDSEMVARMLDTEDPMPPVKAHKPLTPAERDTLIEWVRQGAAYAQPWAYVPPRRVAPPKVSDEKWPRNFVDRWVMARLDAEGLKPSPEADRRTLIRRLNFDLIGLPPTPAEVDAFVNDTDPRAYEKLVDRLLDSPHYGERMAMYWLDLVRYADTVGYHGDQDHNISAYRDWVIKAFNDNAPFDRFTREQLAGDLLDKPTQDQLVATGYNRLLQTSHEGGVQVQEYRAIYQADRIRNFSNVWMGATVGCAQCHDHKYDPYTMKDFYALGAFFADIDDEAHLKNGTNALPTRREPEMWVMTEEDRRRYKTITPRLTQDEKELRNANAKKKQIDGQISKLKKQIEQLKPKIAKADEATKAAPDADTRVTLATAHNKLLAERTDFYAQINKLEIEGQQIAASIVSLENAVKSQRQIINQIESRSRKTMITEALDKPRVVRVLPRGNWLDESGEVVQPAVPHFMPQPANPDNRRLTRLDLANWLTDTSDRGVAGLTARVMANRFFYLAFGNGIAKVLDDFGGQGEPPVHPQLLDALAVEFIDSGWDVKHMMRLLVTSSAYRQSSVAPTQLAERDPYNRLIARQSRFRLPAEFIRDNALAVSGLLVDELYGAPAKPYQPEGYYIHLNFPKREYKADKDAGQYRRGVYTHWQRMFLHPAMLAFDAPTREECTASRTISNTPLQALTLLNDPSYVEAARAFATRILTEGGDTAVSRLDFAFAVALSREPSAAERDLLVKLLDKHRAEFAKDDAATKAVPTTGLSKPPANVNAIDLAAWTSVARTILNLNETITRN